MAVYNFWFGIILILHFIVHLKSESNLQTNLQDERLGNSVFESEKQKMSMSHEKQVTESKNNRHTREVSTNLSSSRFDEPFERLCRDAGSQPCTCYYPDHPDVIQFELSADDVTINASGKNGTGPKNCEDLRLNGHALNGFYMVNFDTKRVNITYCTFSNTAHETNAKSIQLRGTSSSSPVSRLCAGVGTHPCTIYYSDNPDNLPQIEISNILNNKASSNDDLRPTSCDDLRAIGYKNNGFHLVRFNGMKVKIVYCNFDTKLEKTTELQVETKLGDENNSKKVSQLCNGAGSQPCSCYYSKQKYVQQFELSTDQITREASSENGKGPSNCEDLQSIGHTIKGFYPVRSNRKKMKIVFCEFNKLTTANEENNSAKTTLLPATEKYVIPYANTTPNWKILQFMEFYLSAFRPTTKPAQAETPIWKDKISLQLKNDFRKCLAVSKLGTAKSSENGAKIIVTDCNPLENGQLWNFDKNSKRICNGWNKFLSIPNDLKNKKYTDDIFQWDDVAGRESQSWVSYGRQFMNIQSGSCLSVANVSSNQKETPVVVELCDGFRREQLWTFYYI